MLRLLVKCEWDLQIRQECRINVDFSTGRVVVWWRVRVLLFGEIYNGVYKVDGYYVCSFFFIGQKKVSDNGYVYLVGNQNEGDM